MLMKMAKYSVKMGLGYFAMGTKDGNLNFIFNSIQFNSIQFNSVKIYFPYHWPARIQREIKNPGFLEILEKEHFAGLL